jgi:hypothetical protein
MNELKEILDGLDKINAKLEEVINIQKDIVFEATGYYAPPKKSQKEITNGKTL